MWIFFAGVEGTDSDSGYILRFAFERVPFGSSTLYASMELQKNSQLPTATAHGRRKVFNIK